MIEVNLRGSKGDEGRKGATLIRTMGGGGCGIDYGVARYMRRAKAGREMLVDDVLLEGGVGSGEMATKGLRRGIAAVTDRSTREGRGAGANLKPGEFALHEGRMRSATRFAAGVSEALKSRRKMVVGFVFGVHKSEEHGRPSMISSVLEEGMEGPVWYILCWKREEGE